MKTFEEIRTIIQAHNGELRSQYGIIGISVFGSVVRGEATDDSDVDILATFNRPVGLLKLIDAEYYISDLLGSKVDLIPADEVRHELQEQIFNEAVPV
jgi:predicted nucleotidyltransferase